MAWNPTLQRTESQLSGRASVSEGHWFDSTLELCLVPERLSLKPSRSIRFGDVTQANGRGYNLVHRVLSLPPSRMDLACLWSRGTQNPGPWQNLWLGKGSKVVAFSEGTEKAAANFITTSGFTTNHTTPII